MNERQKETVKVGDGPRGKNMVVNTENSLHKNQKQCLSCCLSSLCH